MEFVDQVSVLESVNRARSLKIQTLEELVNESRSELGRKAVEAADVATAQTVKIQT